MSDATVWNITLELSIVILEASYLLIDDVHRTDITYDDYQFTIIICLQISLHPPIQVCMKGLLNIFPHLYSILFLDNISAIFVNVKIKSKIIELNIKF